MEKRTEKGPEWYQSHLSALLLNLLFPGTAKVKPTFSTPIGRIMHWRFVMLWRTAFWKKIIFNRVYAENHNWKSVADLWPYLEVRVPFHWIFNSCLDDFQVFSYMHTNIFSKNWLQMIEVSQILTALLASKTEIGCFRQSSQHPYHAHN